MFKNLSKSQIKTIIAVVLIVVGIVSLVLWEGWGRERVLYKPVLMTSTDIYQGQEIKEDMIQEISVPVELVIDKAYRGNDLSLIIGKISKQFIPTKSQVTPDFFYQNDFLIKEGQALFYCPSSWFLSQTGERSMTTTIRRGDYIEMWSSGGEFKLGEFTVAFAKDDTETEVKNATEQKYQDPLDRVDHTSVVNHMEIICTLNEYKKLHNYVYGIEAKLNLYEETITDEFGKEVTVTIPESPVEIVVANRILVIPKTGDLNK